MAITERQQTPRILVAGCGKLGGAIASQLTGTAKVYGLRRNPDRVPEGVHALGADLMVPEQVRSVLPDNLDIVVYCLTPASYDDKGYHNAYVKGLQNLIDALDGHRLTRLVFIGSSSVYAQDDDSWVDESSSTEPARYSGQAILEGERIALESGSPATVIRFSGIYGPSRARFLDAVMSGGMAPTSPGPYSNLSTKRMRPRPPAISWGGHSQASHLRTATWPAIASPCGSMKWWHGYGNNCPATSLAPTPVKVAAQAVSAVTIGGCWTLDSISATRTSGWATGK